MPCAGLPELKDKVVEATRAHQAGQTAADYALALAAVLERVLLGQSVAAAVADAAAAAPEATQGAIKAAQAQPHTSEADVVQVCATCSACRLREAAPLQLFCWRPQVRVVMRGPVVQATQKLGSNCHLPGSFQCPVVASLYADTYTSGVRASIVAAGDQASRSIVVGALLGAAHGVEGVPKEWQAKVVKMAELEALIDELLKLRFEVADNDS